MEKLTAAKVRRAFNDMTGRQINKRNAAFDEGWRIADYWCGRYLIAKGDECVARVTRNANGSLSITML